MNTQYKGLGDAIALAAISHRSQVDKGGKPYILHCIRVMQSLTTEYEQMVGILHDVLEDCPAITPGYLLDIGYPPEVVVALDILNKKNYPRYQFYITQVSNRPLARRVKIADLRDNLDRSRILNPTEADIARWAKYELALTFLLSVESPNPTT